MEITFQQYTHTGKRPNNEDCVVTDESNGIFLVCDGVGGNNRGEVASEITCKAAVSYFNGQNCVATLDDIKEIVKLSGALISKYIKANPDSEGMATTLAFLQLNSDRAAVSHIGDSRVYHVRNGEIIFQTQDHSLVNEWVASGFITAGEALTHPKKNVITRAIQSDKTSIAEPDFAVITDIQKNDYFFVCSDGVLEAIDNRFIEQFFLDDNSVDMIVSAIQDTCREKSNDNNSAILIKIISI